MGNSCCFNGSSRDNPLSNFDLPEYQRTLCERETTENSSPTHKVIQLKKDQFFRNFVKRTQRSSLISLTQDI